MRLQRTLIHRHEQPCLKPVDADWVQQPCSKMCPLGLRSVNSFSAFAQVLRGEHEGLPFPGHINHPVTIGRASYDGHDAVRTSFDGYAAASGYPQFGSTFSGATGLLDRDTSKSIMKVVEDYSVTLIALHHGLTTPRFARRS